MGSMLMLATGEAQYSGGARGINASPWIRLRSALWRAGGAEKRAGPAGRVAARVLANDALPRGRCRRRLAQVRVAEADSQERVGRRRRRGRHLHHPLELDQRLRVVALHVVRLADPVLRARRERVLRILGDEVEEIE